MGTVRRSVRGRIERWRAWLTALLLLLSLATVSSGAQPGVAPAAKAADGATTAYKPAEVKNAQPVPPERATAAATLNYFFDCINLKHGLTAKDAVKCLDLSALDADTQADTGEILAHRLKRVIDRVIGLPDESRMPDSPEITSYTLYLRQGLEITLERQADGQWYFTRATVASIEELDQETQDIEISEEVAETISGASKPLALQIEENMPAWLRAKFMLLQSWQWIGLLVMIALGFTFERIVTFILNATTNRWLGSLKVDVDKKQQMNMLRALGIVVMTGFWWVGLKWLGLPTTVHSFLLLCVKIVACSGAVWAAYRLVDVICSYLEIKSEATDTKFDDVLVPLIRKTLKTLVVAFGLIFIANNLDVKIWSLLTGLSIGGLAVGFAAKDAIANFFGSITILMDRPFNVGDWVIIGNLEGSVEELGFRSTRIRTFYNSVITVPNENLLTTPVDNMGARRYRRYKAMLSITYDTPPDKIDEFCEGIRELVRTQESMRKDYFHVYMNNFNESSLDILLYVFFEVPDWGVELAERHKFIVSILRLAEEMQVGFAFPTRTVHLVPDPSAAPASDGPQASAP